MNTSTRYLMTALGAGAGLLLAAGGANAVLSDSDDEAAPAEIGSPVVLDEQSQSPAGAATSATSSEDPISETLEPAVEDISDDPLDNGDDGSWSTSGGSLGDDDDDRDDDDRDDDDDREDDDDRDEDDGTDDGTYDGTDDD